MNYNYSIGLLVLRIGLAAVFLWFGFSQIANPEMWLGMVPDWAANIISADTIVMLNGWFELVAGALLLVGFLTRVMALLLALHMVPIIFALGFSPIAVRDFGLSVATLALAFTGPGAYAFSSKPRQTELMQ